MDLEIDGKKIKLLTDKDKEMLGDNDLIQDVYVIAVIAFMEGMKYVKGKNHE